jgi:hypothetical protein
MVGLLVLGLVGLYVGLGEQEREDERTGVFERGLSERGVKKKGVSGDMGESRSIDLHELLEFEHISMFGVRDPVWYVEEYCLNVPDIARYREWTQRRIEAGLVTEAALDRVERRLMEADEILAMPWAGVCKRFGVERD